MAYGGVLWPSLPSQETKSLGESNGPSKLLLKPLGLQTPQPQIF